MPRLLLSMLLSLATLPLAAQDMPLSEIIRAGVGWHRHPNEFAFITGLATNAKGELFIADADLGRVQRCDTAREVHPFSEPAYRIFGIAFGKGGELFGIDGEKGELVRFDDRGDTVTLGKGLRAALHLTVHPTGDIYIADGNQATPQLWRFHDGKMAVALKLPEGVQPTGLAFRADGAFLYMGDTADRYLRAITVEKDGALGTFDRYHRLRVKPPATTCHAHGLTTDASGRTYAATDLGVQVFDPTGRLCGVLPLPGNTPATHVAFAGAAGEYLYAASGPHLYYRTMQARGLQPAQKAE